MKVRRQIAVAVGATTLVALMAVGTAAANGPTVTMQKYDWKDAAQYNAKWAAPYGPGEGTQSFQTNAVTVAAVPFTTGADLSVFDHLKYIRTSTAAFPVPTAGSVEISAVKIDTHKKRHEI